MLLLTTFGSGLGLDQVYLSMHHTFIDIGRWLEHTWMTSVNYYYTVSVHESRQSQCEEDAFRQHVNSKLMSESDVGVWLNLPTETNTEKCRGCSSW